jgi:hypothetical protein
MSAHTNVPTNNPPTTLGVSWVLRPTYLPTDNPPTTLGVSLVLRPTHPHTIFLQPWQPIEKTSTSTSIQTWVSNKKSSSMQPSQSVSQSYMVMAWPPEAKRMFVVPVKKLSKLMGAECFTPGVCAQECDFICIWSFRAWYNDDFSKNLLLSKSATSIEFTWGNGSSSFIHDQVNLMKLRKFEIHLSMCDGRDEHVPSCVCGGQYSQEGPDPEIVDGG